MAIAGKNLTGKVAKDIPVAEEIREPRKSTFTSLMPEVRAETLLRYAAGYPWTVNYYGQILNEASTLNHFDPGQGNLSQSYVEIKELVLKVENPLSYSYNAEDGVSELTGSGIMPFKVRPNVGDIFVAMIDDGEDAIFNITEVTRATHRKQTLYQVEYTLHSYTNDRPEFLEKVKARIHDSYYYNNYLNAQSTDVLITPKEKVYNDDLRLFMHDSQTYYFRAFLQTYSQSLALPGLDTIYYDPLIVDFIFKTTEASEYGAVRSYTHNPTSLDYKRESILDAIFTKRIPNKARYERKYGFIGANSLWRNATLGSFNFGVVSHVLHPIDADRKNLSRPISPSGIPVSDPTSSDNYYFDDTLVVDVPTKDGFTKLQVLPTLFDDGYYIVSENFYKYLDGEVDRDALSYTEVLLIRFLKHETLSLDDLHKLVEDWHDWSPLHQFYILPIAWIMIKNMLGVV